MLKNPAYFHPVHLGETAFAASRQLWLAGLGATAVTREWVQSEAGAMFKTLVKEGTAVEARAIRLVGNRLETSVNRANTAWKRTRRTVESSVKQAADAAVDFAQQVLPRTLPIFEQSAAKVAVRPAAKAKRAAKRTPAKAKRKVKAGAKQA